MMKLIDKATRLAAQGRAAGVIQRFGVQAIHNHGASIGTFQQACDLQEGRFTGTGGAYQRNRFTGTNTQRTSAQHTQGLSRLLKGAFDAAKLKNRLTHISKPRPDRAWPRAKMDKAWRGRKGQAPS